MCFANMEAQSGAFDATIAKVLVRLTHLDPCCTDMEVQQAVFGHLTEVLAFCTCWLLFPCCLPPLMRSTLLVMPQLLTFVSWSAQTARVWKQARPAAAAALF